MSETAAIRDENIRRFYHCKFPTGQSLITWITSRIKPLLTKLGIMPHLSDTRHRWYLRLFCNILCQGPIPKHIGLILDGNRRYARKKVMKIVDGHRQGFAKIWNAVRWAKDLGIKEITVYAFSIENFKRPEKEVEDLMDLITYGLAKHIKEAEDLKNEGVCIEVIGDLSRCRPNIRKMVAQVMLLTRNNSKIKLTYALAYTSRYEMAQGVKSLHWGIKTGQLLQEDINEDLFGQTFNASPRYPLDLLVRTSGEHRLSDFMLWQGTTTILHFIPIMWPEMNFWIFLKIMLNYQVDRMKMTKKIVSNKSIKQDCGSEIQQPKFIASLRDQKWKVLEMESQNECDLNCFT